MNFVGKKRWGHLGKWGYTTDRTNPDETIQWEAQGSLERMQRRKFS